MTIRMLDENRCPICGGWHDNNCLYENMTCPYIPITPEEIAKLVDGSSPLKSDELIAFELTVLVSHRSCCLLDQQTCHNCRVKKKIGRSLQ